MPSYFDAPRLLSLRCVATSRETEWLDYAGVRGSLTVGNWLADARCIAYPLDINALGIAPELRTPHEVILVESSSQGGLTMFDQIFERSDTLRRQLAGLLREERLAYLHHRAEQGAPRGTLRKLAQYLLVITERLNLRHQGTVTPRR